MPLRRLHPRDFFAVLDRRAGACLVVFTAPACGSCHRARALLGAMDVEALEVDASEAPGLVDELEIRHLPAFFAWRDGEFHGELRPRLLTAEILTAFEEALARPPMDMP